jgi:hypothetical protein
MVHKTKKFDELTPEEQTKIWRKSYKKSKKKRMVI